jgi:hypothetical protein
VMWVPVISRPWNCGELLKGKHPSKFCNQEIATVHGPPHLLKCTWNLFLKYDVHLKSEVLGNQLPVVVKWQHILKLYECDIPNWFLLMYKLTDAHLIPVADCN